MTGGPDYILDVAGLSPDGSPTREKRASQGRPWLAVHWRCCSVYSRIYRNKDATAYEGRCPHCARPVHALIGAEGTNKRFFEAS